MAKGSSYSPLTNRLQHIEPNPFMAATKKEIEEDIAKLSAFINRKTGSFRYVFKNLEDYFDKEGALGDFVEKSKPMFKKQKLGVEIFALKAQLELLKRLIARRRKMERTHRKQKAETKKGGSEPPFFV